MAIPQGTRRMTAPHERLVERSLETVRTNSLMLTGGRRVVRTALRHELRRRLHDLEDAEYVFFPVSVDLEGIPAARFFGRVAESIFGDLAGDLHGLTPSFAPASPHYGYRDLLGDLRRVLRRLSAEQERCVKLTLLIDGLEQLDGYGPQVNQKLRSLFMRSFAEHLVAVVVGSGVGEVWRRVGSPWYNFFEEIDVGVADRESAAEARVSGPG